MARFPGEAGLSAELCEAFLTVSPFNVRLSKTSLNDRIYTRDHPYTCEEEKRAFLRQESSGDTFQGAGCPLVMDAEFFAWAEN